MDKPHWHFMRASVNIHEEEIQELGDALAAERRFGWGNLGFGNPVAPQPPTDLDSDPASRSLDVCCYYCSDCCCDCTPMRSFALFCAVWHTSVESGSASCCCPKFDELCSA